MGRAGKPWVWEGILKGEGSLAAVWRGGWEWQERSQGRGHKHSGEARGDGVNGAEGAEGYEELGGGLSLI